MYSTTGEKKMYDTIKLPHDLVLRVEKLISKSDMGYRNKSEFIIEAVREKVSEISKMESAKEMKA